jgi:hypothetical protein
MQADDLTHSPARTVAALFRYVQIMVQLQNSSMIQHLVIYVHYVLEYCWAHLRPRHPLRSFEGIAVLPARHHQLKSCGPIIARPLVDRVP